MHHSVSLNFLEANQLRDSAGPNVMSQAMQILSNTLRLLVDELGADCAMLLVRSGNVNVPVASHNVGLAHGRKVAPYIAMAGDDPHRIVTLYGEEIRAAFRESGLAEVPDWHASLGFRLRSYGGGNEMTVVVRRYADRPFVLSGALERRITAIREILQDELHLLAEMNEQAACIAAATPDHALREERAEFLAEPAPPPVPAAPEGAYACLAQDATSAFLFETLLVRRSIRKRGAISYHGIRNWRAAIKPHQVSAMQIMKRHLHPPFVGMIAAEMVQWVEDTFGGAIFDAVVPVPCGHGGEGCLSSQLGREVAARLGIEAVPAFATIPVTGSSHPRTNATRPAMKLLAPVPGNVLLVDDIATSGAHITEAARLLRAKSRSVSAVSWIVDR